MGTISCGFGASTNAQGFHSEPSNDPGFHPISQIWVDERWWEWHDCWGLYSLVCPWTGHILAGTRFLKLKRIFLGSRREAISPLIFTHKFGERRIEIKVLTERVTPNRFGPAGPIDTSVRQRTNSSIGTGPSGFLQHALQIYTRASSSGKRRDKKHTKNRRKSSSGLHDRSSPRERTKPQVHE